MKITYDQGLLQYMSLFENFTKAKLKDCFYDENLAALTFIVQPGELGKAVGKKGETIKHVGQLLKKRIRVIEFSEDKLQFIKNMVQPLQVDSIEERGGKVVLQSADVKIKGLLIGKNAKNLRNLEKNVGRYFEVEEIRVE
ncbi:NusA-like transcription termination signal-binding factor [Candidatus Woesearchaeota archaeon]|nr:NusA-like transcription termination signal-binding factor [Candidatus Woesearchaeota archaeon]